MFNFIEKWRRVKEERQRLQEQRNVSFKVLDELPADIYLDGRWPFDDKCFRCRELRAVVVERVKENLTSPSGETFCHVGETELGSLCFRCQEITVGPFFSRNRKRMSIQEWAQKFRSEREKVV